MPQFGEPNTPASFPSWTAGGVPGRISWHPHPGTPRIDGRLRWPSDSRVRALHGRAYSRLWWSEDGVFNPGAGVGNYETVYWEWRATGPAEATAFTSLTSSGRYAVLRMRYLDVLPLDGGPGTELFIQYYKDDVPIGARTRQYPDSLGGIEFDSPLSIGTPGPLLSHPDATDPISPGHWAAMGPVPIPECWRWFDTQRTTFCPYENDVNGMASIKIRIHEFGWGLNEFKPGGGLTKVQEEFADTIKSDWIVRPVFSEVSGWVSCHLEYKSPFFWDPVGSDFPGTAGLYYGFAIRVIFNSNLFLWTLHVRTWRAQFVDPNWEIPISQSLDSGVNFLLGVNGALFADNLNGPAPFESRNIEQYQIDNLIWPRFGPMGPFGLQGFDPIRVSLKNVTAFERGLELPSAGPLTMIRRFNHALVKHDGTTPSVTSFTKIPFGAQLFNAAEWIDDTNFPDQFVVPPGVTMVEGLAQASAGSSSNTISLKWFHNDLVPEVEGYSRTNPDSSQFDIIQAHQPPLIVAPGDRIHAEVTKGSSSLSSNTERTYVYVRAIDPGIEPVSIPAVAYGDPIPGSGTQILGFRVPPSLDDTEIESVSASLGQSQSTSGDVQVALSWIRQSGHAIDDITDVPITIEMNHWNSDSATTQPTLFPNGKIANTGDICMLLIQQSGANATGLVINFDLRERP